MRPMSGMKGHRTESGLHQIVGKNPDKMTLARTPDDIRAAAAAGKIAALMGMA